MGKAAIVLGNSLIDSIEAMQNDLTPKRMNKDLDLVEEAIDDNEIEVLRAYQRALEHKTGPGNQYVPFKDIQRLIDELYDLGVDDAESLITPERLDAFRAVSSKVVRFGRKPWSKASILAVVHPEDATLIAALVIDRNIESWDGLKRALAALKNLSSVPAKVA